MAEPVENCGNCRFWCGHDKYIGTCRRYPPQLVSSEFKAAVNDDDVAIPAYAASFFPETADFDWCGEYLPLRTPPAASDAPPSETVASAPAPGGSTRAASGG